MDFIDTAFDSPIDAVYPLASTTAELTSSQLQAFIHKILSTLDPGSLCSVYFNQICNHLPVRNLCLKGIDPTLVMGADNSVIDRPTRVDINIGTSSDEHPDDICSYYFTRTLTRGERNLLGQLHFIFAQQFKQAQTFTRLKQIATKDSLTGLSNRNGFNESSLRLISRAARYKKPFALLVIDLDNFKQVNDTLGHTEGDAVLEHVAAIIRNTLRCEDEAFRFGGDEFCCLLDCANEQCIDSIAARIHDQINQDEMLIRRQVSCSIGGAAYQSGDDINSLFDRADGALYAVKANGKNAYAAA